MLKPRERWFTIGVISGLVLLTTVPYLIAVNNAGEDYVFGGFLLNPLDGNSYLAKMYQGWRGDIKFTLPYTQEIGEGTYLFMFYLLLGHLARFGGIPLILTFHIFRLFASLLMLLSLYHFIADIVSDVQTRRVAFFLAAFGSGLGWLFIAFGLFTTDFWVAEAYPFLSAYANPHFPMSIALLLFLLSINSSGSSRIDNWGSGISIFLLIISTILLAIISPFGVVLAIFILGIMTLWDTKISLNVIKGSPYAYRFLLVLLSGTPILIYYLWVINADPLLRIWNSQNLTESPPVWDLIISFSPILIFSILSSRTILAHKKNKSAIMVIFWSIIGFIMLYVPVGLQRRFMMGLYIPLVILAAIWISEKISKTRRSLIWVVVIILFIIPTNLIILLAGWSGIQTHDTTIYHTRGESRAFDWIENHTTSDALILASADTGLLIPAYTGRRVIYGHPYETVNADAKKALVTGFFGSERDQLAFDEFNDVDYVFVGPREIEQGGVPMGLDMHKIYDFDGVVIYEREW